MQRGRIIRSGGAKEEAADKISRLTNIYLRRKLAAPHGMGPVFQHMTRNSIDVQSKRVI